MNAHAVTLISALVRDLAEAGVWLALAVAFFRGTMPSVPCEFRLLRGATIVIGMTVIVSFAAEHIR